MSHSIQADRAVLSVTEASTVSGYSRQHVNYLIGQGYLDAVKVGNAWLVYEDSLRRYMAAPRRPGPKPRASQGKDSA
jgi:excisionase family DNA binding protein